jgi:hypothetical protein
MIWLLLTKVTICCMVMSQAMSQTGCTEQRCVNIVTRQIIEHVWHPVHIHIYRLRDGNGPAMTTEPLSLWCTCTTI